MIVHVVVIDPKGSCGGFEWRETLDEASAERESLERQGVPTLGIIECGVSDQHESNDDVTHEIDSYLPELERALGYDPSGHGGNIIVLSYEDTARLMSLTADLEQLDLEGRIPWEAINAVEDLSRIAAIVNGQVEGQ